MFEKKLHWFRRLFARRIQSNLDLPKGTRFFDDDKGFILVERPPQKRTILCHDKNYFLYFPYTAFVVQYRKEVRRYVSGDQLNYSCEYFHAGFSEVSLILGTDYLAALPLSNYRVPENFMVCMGNANVRKANSLTEMVEQMISNYWQSYFAGILNQIPYNEYTPITWSAISHHTKPNLEFLLKNHKPICKIFPLIKKKTRFLDL